MATAPLLSRSVNAAVAACVLWVTLPTAGAGVIFSQSGDDLLINIDDSITLNATADFSNSIFVLAFHDVYSVDNTAPLGKVPPVVTSTMSFDGNTSNAYNVWFQTASTNGAIDANGFYGLYQFGSAQTLNIGDVVQISPGTVTLPKFFSEANAVMPDLPAMNVQLLSNTGVVASDLVSVSAVPEPSSVVLFTLGLGGFWIRRRRRLSADD